MGIKARRKNSRKLLSHDTEVVASVQAESTEQTSAKRKVVRLVTDWQGFQQQEDRSVGEMKQNKEQWAQ